MRAALVPVAEDHVELGIEVSGDPECHLQPEYRAQVRLALDSQGGGTSYRRTRPHRRTRTLVTRREGDRGSAHRATAVVRPALGLLRCVYDLGCRRAGVKAVLYERYGSPDVLHVEDVPMPLPATGQVRVKVAATSVNLSDWECLRGSPAYARLGGLRYPARRTLGSDIAGVVDVVGEAVTGFRPGDEVYGDNLGLMGGFAEYALAPESALAHKPAQLTFAEASTIPQAGAIALQGTEIASSGKRVLINGAGGGTGSFAIQLAKRLGAHVTGVDNATKQDFMRSMGADDVIDYRRDDFTRTTRPYSLVLDMVAHRSVFAYRRARWHPAVGIGA